MPFQPFRNVIVERRIVKIPGQLDAVARERFIQKISAAARQQSQLAEKCDSILKITGDPVIETDRIVIPHEPACCIDPAAVTSKENLPDIETLWWLSRATLRALAAVPPGTPHGGIMLASLHQDELGRIKLGDLGIAPCFEDVCGTEQRRQIHCDGEKWELLGEEDAREFGWIAPYFAHEMLEGRQRLNPKADQFAAGVTLYLLGTGGHPYGVGLDDPTLMLYFHLEPFPVAEERGEWAKAYERAAQELSTTADKSILGWGNFVQKLLASDPGERFAGAAEALQQTAEYCPEEWERAEQTLRQALERLEEGEAEAALRAVAALKSEERLPALWRTPLDRWCAELEERKNEIGGERRLKRRLAEGWAALNNVEVDRAREIAEAVLASPQCNEEMAGGARELIDYCKEQQEFIQTGADELARAYLQSAKELIEREAYDDARTVLSGLLNDPATPKARANQTRQLLGDIELLVQRREQQQAELNGAEQDLHAGRLEAARQRLEALNTASELPSETRDRLMQLLDEVQAEQERRAELVAALDAARTAWERADESTLAAELTKVPEETSDPEMADMRRDLAGRLDALRVALKERAAIRAAAESDQPEAGLVHVERAAQLEVLPQILRDEIESERRRLQERIDDRRRVWLDQVLGRVQAAREACADLRIDECRRRLEKEILPQEGLPEEITREAEVLRETCERIEQNLQQFDYARTHLQDEDFDGAVALLERMRLQGLPAELQQKRDTLRDEIDAARREKREREKRCLTEMVERVERAVGDGNLAEAHAGLEQCKDIPDWASELRKRITTARQAVERWQPTVDALRELEVATEKDASKSDSLAEKLPALPADAPSWLAARHEKIRNRIEEARAKQRQERHARAVALLDQAEAALSEGDLTSGTAFLEEYRLIPDADAALREREEQLRRTAADLGQWLPALEWAEKLIAGEDWLAAQHEITELAKRENPPPICRNRIAVQKRRVEEAIARHRSEIDAEVMELQQTLSEQGRKTRRFEKRIVAVRDDALSTDMQRKQADELAACWESLETPRRSKSAYIAVAGIAAAAAILGGLYFGGAFRFEPQKPLTPASAHAAEAPSETTTAIKPAEQPQTQPQDTAQITPVVESQPVVVVPESPVVGKELERDIQEQQVSSSEPTTPVVEVEKVQTPPVEEPAAAVMETPVTEPTPQERIPTVEEAAQAYVGEVREHLPKALRNVVRVGDVLPADANDYQIDAQWQGRDLLAFNHLAFDGPSGQFSPPPADIAEYFVLQIEAFRAAAQPVEWTSPPTVAGATVQSVQLKYEPSVADGVAEVDREEKRVRLHGTARLAQDQRADAGFECEAIYGDGRLRLDESAGAAYAEYYKNLKFEHLETLARQLTDHFKLPDGLQVQIDERSDGGDETTLALVAARNQTWAEFHPTWDATELQYKLDTNQARATIRAGLESQALNPTRRATLDEGWRTLREEIAQSLDANRRALIQRCEIQEVKPAASDSAELWRVPLELRVGAGDQPPQFQVSAALVVRAVELAWDERANPAAQAVIAKQLASAAQTLEERLTSLAARETPSPAEFHAALLDVTRDKLERYGAGRYVIADDFAQAPDAEAALTALSAALQDLVAPEPQRDAFPTVFIEYYLGKERAFGLAWHVATDKTDAILGVERLKVWEIAASVNTRLRQNPATFRAAYSSEPEIGEALFGAALGEAIRGSGGGSFGVLIAPDGPLWLVRWEQVKFAPRTVQGVDLRGSTDPGSITDLRTLLRPQRGGRQDFTWRRVGIWCVPTLAGRWTGPPDQIDELNLGSLVPGKKQSMARFKNWGQMTFATITDPLLAGDFGWARFAENVTPEEIGHLFWDRQWSGETWQPTPFTSFALIQIP